MRLAALDDATSTTGVVLVVTGWCMSSSSEWLAVRTGRDTSDWERVIFGGGLASRAFTLTLLEPFLVSTRSVSGSSGGGKVETALPLAPLLDLCRKRARPSDENLPLLLTPEGIGEVGGLMSAGLELVRIIDTELTDEAVCLRCNGAGGGFVLVPFPDLSALFRVNSNPVHCLAQVILCRTARFAIVTLTEPDFFIRYSMPQFVQKRANKKKSNEQNRSNRQYNVMPSNILLLFRTNAISRRAKIQNM